jgi:hypothetical protein
MKFNLAFYIIVISESMITIMSVIIFIKGKWKSEIV